MSDLVENPEDRFSHNEARIFVVCFPESVIHVPKATFLILIFKRYNLGRFYSGQFFQIFFFCFVVAICDLVQDVETMHGQC